MSNSECRIPNFECVGRYICVVSEAHDSGAGFAVAVEVHHVATMKPFAQGVCVGFSIALLLAQAYLVRFGMMLRGMFGFNGPSDFFTGVDALPSATRLVLSRGWLFGAPAVGAIAIAVLVWRRPRGVWPYLLVMGLLAAAAGGTWYFADAPISELAGSIQE